METVAWALGALLAGFVLGFFGAWLFFGLQLRRRDGDRRRLRTELHRAKELLRELRETWLYADNDPAEVRPGPKGDA